MTICIGGVLRFCREPVAVKYLYYTGGINCAKTCTAFGARATSRPCSTWHTPSPHPSSKPARETQRGQEDKMRFGGSSQLLQGGSMDAERGKRQATHTHTHTFHASAGDPARMGGRVGGGRGDGPETNQKPHTTRDRCHGAPCSR